MRLIAILPFAVLALITGCTSDRETSSEDKPTTVVTSKKAQDKEGGLDGENKSATGVITITWDEQAARAYYKFDGHPLMGTDTEDPKVPGLNNKSLIRELERRRGANPEFRLLVLADKQVQAKYIHNALRWGAAAGTDNIAFSATPASHAP